MSGIFRVRSATVEAVQFTGDNIQECTDFALNSWLSCSNDHFEVRNDVGDTWAQVGDWIVRGVTGMLFVVPEDRFLATYESVGVSQL